MFNKGTDIKYYATPSGEYYGKIMQSIDSLVQKMDEIIKGQQDIKEMLSGMSVTPSIIESTAETIHELEKEVIPKQVEQVEQVEPVVKSKPKYCVNGRENARQFILNFLADGERSVGEMDNLAKNADNFSFSVYQVAKQELNQTGKIVTRRIWKKHFARLAGTEPTEQPESTKPKQPKAVKSKQPKSVKDQISIKEIIDTTTKDYRSFYSKVNNLAYKVLQLAPEGKYKTCASVYKDVWAQMTAQYGICWAQMGKEAKRKYGLERAPHKLDLCYEDETAKSIFVAKLEDMAYNLQAEKEKGNAA